MSLGQYNVYQYQMKISFYPSCDKYHLPNKMVSTVLCRLEKLTVGSIKDRSTIWHYDLWNKEYNIYFNHTFTIDTKILMKDGHKIDIHVL